MLCDALRFPFVNECTRVYPQTAPIQCAEVCLIDKEGMLVKLMWHDPHKKNKTVNVCGSTAVVISDKKKHLFLNKDNLMSHHPCQKNLKNPLSQKMRNCMFGFFHCVLLCLSHRYYSGSSTLQPDEVPFSLYSSYSFTHMIFILVDLFSFVYTHLIRSLLKEKALSLQRGWQIRNNAEGGAPGSDFLYRRMASEARGDLFVKATCRENSDQSLTLFLTE